MQQPEVFEAAVQHHNQMLSEMPNAPAVVAAASVLMALPEQGWALCQAANAELLGALAESGIHVYEEELPALREVCGTFLAYWNVELEARRNERMPTIDVQLYKNRHGDYTMRAATGSIVGEPVVLTHEADIAFVERVWAGISVGVANALDDGGDSDESQTTDD